MIYRSKRRLITSIGSNLLSNHFPRPVVKTTAELLKKKQVLLECSEGSRANVCFIYTYPISIGRGSNEPDLGQCTSNSRLHDRLLKIERKKHAFGSTQPVCILEQIPGNLLVIAMKKKWEFWWIRIGDFVHWWYNNILSYNYGVRCGCELIQNTYVIDLNTKYNTGHRVGHRVQVNFTLKLVGRNISYSKTCFVMSLL